MSDKIIPEIRSLTNRTEPDEAIRTIMRHFSSNITKTEELEVSIQYTKDIISKNQTPRIFTFTSASFLIIEDATITIQTNKHDGLYSRATLEHHWEERDRLYDLLLGIPKPNAPRRPNGEFMKQAIINTHCAISDVLFLRNQPEEMWVEIINMMHTEKINFDHTLCQKLTNEGHQTIYIHKDATHLDLHLVFTSSKIVEELFEYSDQKLESISTNQWWEPSDEINQARLRLNDIIRSVQFDGSAITLLIDNQEESFHSIQEIRQRLTEEYLNTYERNTPRTGGCFQRSYTPPTDVIGTDIHQTMYSMLYYQMGVYDVENLQNNELWDNDIRNNGL